MSNVWSNLFLIFAFLAFYGLGIVHGIDAERHRTKKDPKRG